MAYNGYPVAETTATDGTPFRVILEPDQDAENPRESYDTHAGVIHVRTQPRYNVPRETDVLHDLYLVEHDFRVVARWLRIFHGATVVLPLYSNWNGGFNITAGDVTDAPAAGDYIGVTFDTPATRKASGLEPSYRAEMAASLASDVQHYASWADGDVWGYTVQTAWVDDGDGEITGWDATDDSCWGFIGQDWAEQAAEEALDAYVATYDDQVAARIAREADDAAEIDDLRRCELGLPA